MTKNIEIEIKNEIYERFKNESVKYNMDIQSYISLVLENHDYSSIQNHNYIEEKVKKPLKKILTDLEGLNGDTKISTPKRVLLIPLKIYNKPLPKGFSRLIGYYKNKGWYDVENFYLITDGKSILGYLGLNISEEDAPYGRYLYIYGLNLYREYQNSTNLKYIINYVQSIGRQGQCYSIDILFENSNIPYNQLKEFGFLLFISTDIIKIKKEIDNNKINIKLLESKKCSIEDIGQFLPIVRTEPFKPLLSQWMERIKDIEVYNNIYKDGEIEFIYIKEDKVIDKTIYNYFTLLVDPKYLYDDKYISKVFSILKLIISKDSDSDKDCIIPITRNITKDLLIYSEDEILDSLSWLRKNNA